MGEIQTDRVYYCVKYYVPHCKEVMKRPILIAAAINSFTEVCHFFQTPCLASKHAVRLFANRMVEGTPPSPIRVSPKILAAIVRSVGTHDRSSQLVVLSWLDSWISS